MLFQTCMNFSLLLNTIYIYIYFEEEEFGYPKFHMYTFFTDEEEHAEICLDPPLIGCYLIV